MSDAGTHTITVTATDAYSHYGSAQATILVSGSGTAASSGSTLDQLEAELRQDEAQIASLGGSASGATTSYAFSDDLSPGITSQEVTDLQTVLTKTGDYTGPITGYYGSLTEAAVEKFQAENGIEQLGVVGPQTRTALNALMVPLSSSTASSAGVGDGYVFDDFIGYGDTGVDVTELQKRLTAFGVYSGPVTGYFGSLTQTAVESFQGQHGIEQAGYVGPATRAALNQ